MKFPSLALACVLAFAALESLRAQDAEARLSNLSTRAQVGTGGDIMITGFVIGPGADKTILIRAIGPSLSTFGLTGLLADPSLSLFTSANTTTPIATNDNWSAADAATFTSVGAFVLPANSRDAALVRTLPPGGYTAQVRGAGTTTGLALIELYEVGSTPGSTRLINLSTRALVGTGATVMIPGITIAPGAGVRKLLIRAAGPALTALGVPGALADPTITIVTSAGVTVATSDNWTIPAPNANVDAALLAATFTRAGAFAFPAGSKDAAVLADFGPGGYTVQVSGIANTTGVALVEVYDVTSGPTPTVSIAATKAAADESGNKPGEITLTRTGDLFFPLTASYTVGGSAINGYDYPFIAGSSTFPSGVATLKIPVAPNPDVQVEGTDTVTLTLNASPSYTIAYAPTATVSIADSPATLYLASVRPTSAALAGSTGSGTASVLLSSSGTVAAVNVTFTGLSSTQTNAYLVLGANEDFVFSLGTSGQVSGSQWTFTPVGAYTSTALIDALKSGNISVRIDSAKFPTGELKGTFIQSTGSQAFTAPDAAPAIALNGITAADAARFLTQATFGPTKTEIDALTGGSIDSWITGQLSLPFTSHRAATVADRAAFGGSNSFTNWNAIHLQNRQSAWFKIALTAPDQLRQRVAYALSQILVISDISLGEDSHTEPVANYYDILGNGAFGNFRTLLENVTLSPMMGMYLSSLRNAKADPVTGQTPDENYAREIMQLFTIGLDQLQPDGTLRLDAAGLPIPTYDQTTITELAKVFTGWAYPSTNLAAFRTASTNYFSPMQLFPAFHDDTVKNLTPVTSTPIPAAQGGTQDLKLALDALFNHANTPPFISKLLIQRLVTSNPSPGYVYRVAQKFVNNGSGTRGDLAAVVRAILTDYEARSPAVAGNATYGKLKEPLLRLTGLMRSFGASSTSGRYLGYRHTAFNLPIDGTTPKPADSKDITATLSSAINIHNTLGNIAQAALRSPTVFNFYHPDYVLPGPLAAAGLVAPEFEITDDNYAISVPNYLRTFVNATTTGIAATIQPYVIALNTTYEQTLVSNPTALVDHLNTVLCAGTLPAAARTRIITALSALATSTTNEDRAKTAILLVLTTPAAAIQK